MLIPFFYFFVLGLFRPSWSLLAAKLRPHLSCPLVERIGNLGCPLNEGIESSINWPPFGYSLRVYFVFFSFWKRLFLGLWYIFVLLSSLREDPKGYWENKFYPWGLSTRGRPSLFEYKKRVLYLSCVHWNFKSNKEIVGIEPTIENRHCVANSPITILAYLLTLSSPLVEIKGRFSPLHFTPWGPLVERTGGPIDRIRKLGFVISYLSSKWNNIRKFKPHLQNVSIR